MPQPKAVRRGEAAGRVGRTSLVEPSSGARDRPRDLDHRRRANSLTVVRRRKDCLILGYPTRLARASLRLAVCTAGYHPVRCESLTWLLCRCPLDEDVVIAGIPPRLALLKANSPPVVNQPLTRLHHSCLRQLKKPWTARDCRLYCGSGWTLHQDRSAFLYASAMSQLLSSVARCGKGESAGPVSSDGQAIPVRDTRTCSRPFRVWPRTL